MRPDAARVLYHIQIAIALISRFTAGKSLVEYNPDIMMRSAVERQLIAIGEAVSVLSKIDPESARRITDWRRIIAIRNRLRMAFSM